MKILVAGANGKIGTILCGKLWAHPYFSPVALIRDERQQMKFTALGVPSVVGDLEDGLAQFLPDLDAVVFSAGSGSRTGPEKTIDVDQNAAIRLIEDCERTNLRRFLMVSAIGADPNSESERIGHYYRAKGLADDRLRASSLDYLIVAPGRLTDERGSGSVDLAENLGRNGTIPREDVADVIVAALEHPAVTGKTIQVLAGDVSVKEAVADAFGGPPPPLIA
ncbi:MAG: NAD-dependent dehydratase [Opitutales bacterium]|nr:NAD-dependent dehydratase [Opitutales bacterium]